MLRVKISREGEIPYKKGKARALKKIINQELPVTKEKINELMGRNKILFQIFDNSHKMSAEEFKEYTKGVEYKLIRGGYKAFFTEADIQNWNKNMSM